MGSESPRLESGNAFRSVDAFNARMSEAKTLESTATSPQEKAELTAKIKVLVSLLPAVKTELGTKGLQNAVKDLKGLLQSAEGLHEKGDFQLNHIQSDSKLYKAAYALNEVAKDICLAVPMEKPKVPDASLPHSSPSPSSSSTSSTSRSKLAKVGGFLKSSISSMKSGKAGNKSLNETSGLTRMEIKFDRGEVERLLESTVTQIKGEKPDPESSSAFERMNAQCCSNARTMDISSGYFERPFAVGVNSVLNSTKPQSSDLTRLEKQFLLTKMELVSTYASTKQRESSYGPTQSNSMYFLQGGDLNKQYKEVTGEKAEDRYENIQDHCQQLLQRYERLKAELKA